MFTEYDKRKERCLFGERVQRNMTEQRDDSQTCLCQLYSVLYLESVESPVDIYIYHTAPMFFKDKYFPGIYLFYQKYIIVLQIM